MKRSIFAVILLAIALGIWLPAAAPASAAAAADGQAIFAENCAQCHSTTAAAKVGPGLGGLFKKKTLPGTGRPTTEANVTSQIKSGGGGMPGFGDKLDAAQIGALVAYLKTL